jgi:hypothetical protein
MTATAYDHATHIAGKLLPGERILGRRSPGRVFLWIAWVAGASLLVGLGGMIGVGVLLAARD